MKSNILDKPYEKCSKSTRTYRGARTGKLVTMLLPHSRNAECIHKTPMSKKGIVVETMRCKGCGGVWTNELDYAVLSDVFSIPVRRAK